MQRLPVTNNVEHSQSCFGSLCFCVCVSSCIRMGVRVVAGGGSVASCGLFCVQVCTDWSCLARVFACTRGASYILIRAVCLHLALAHAGNVLHGECKSPHFAGEMLHLLTHFFCHVENERFWHFFFHFHVLLPLKSHAGHRVFQ